MRSSSEEQSAARDLVAPQPLVDRIAIIHLMTVRAEVAELVDAHV
jgi:hypothetical protein